MSAWVETGTDMTTEFDPEAWLAEHSDLARAWRSSSIYAGDHLQALMKHADWLATSHWAREGEVKEVYARLADAQQEIARLRGCVARCLSRQAIRLGDLVPGADIIASDKPVDVIAKLQRQIDMRAAAAAYLQDPMPPHDHNWMTGEPAASEEERAAWWARRQPKLEWPDDHPNIDFTALPPAAEAFMHAAPDPEEAEALIADVVRLADNYAGACAGCDPGEFATKERSELHAAINKLVVGSV